MLHDTTKEQFWFYSLLPLTKSELTYDIMEYEGAMFYFNHCSRSFDAILLYSLATDEIFLVQFCCLFTDVS